MKRFGYPIEDCRFLASPIDYIIFDGAAQGNVSHITFMDIKTGPTANLDKENSYQILELMLDLNKKFDAAFVFSTHDEKVTKFIRREIGLEDGYVKWDKRRNGAGDFE